MKHRAIATVTIVTFVTLVLELTSTRLFAYIGSTHATSAALSVALLGLGLGAFVRLRFPDRVTPQRAAFGLAGSLWGLALATSLGAPLFALVAIALVPFAHAGALVSDAYASRGSTNARATYAFDLFAAAAGCLVAPHLLGPLSPAEIMIVLGLFSCVLAGKAGAVIAIAHIGLLIVGRVGALPDGPLEVLLRSDPHSEKAIVETHASSRDIVDSMWSPIGRADVHRRDRDRLGVYTDGMSPTYMIEESRAKAGTFEATWGLLMSLPYRALHPERVLILGAGAGASVWLAKKYGASQVDAVEVNPAIPAILARWKHFAGDVYHQPGVRYFTEDARRYLADTNERYDLIELALALTGNVQAVQPSGMEANLYTVEAVRLYLSRLTPRGALVLIHSDPGNAYRQLLTVLEALGTTRERGLDGIAVLHDARPGTAYRFMLIVRTSPIPLDVADAFDVDDAELLWGPGDPPERRAKLLDPASLGVTGRDDFTPVHDERPFFFQNTKGLVATALAEPGRMWVGIGALVLVLILSVERREDTAFARSAGVATALGAAFICVELALIQRLTLAAGGALYAVSFVLFSLLAWTAAGSLVLGRVWRGLDRGVTFACLAAAIAVAVTAFIVRDLGWLEAISSEPIRLIIIVALLAPIGLAIGCPFPGLLAQSSTRIASLWGINGAASVAGGVVGVLALRVGGSTHALLIAAGLYLAAAALATTRASRPVA